jgi:hypothetical protein
MGGGASPLEVRAEVVINPDEDGGQLTLAGRLFVLSGQYALGYAASRRVAVRTSGVLLILRLEYFRYYP